jgi:hypothetical protein
MKELAVRLGLRCPAVLGVALLASCVPPRRPYRISGQVINAFAHGVPVKGVHILVVELGDSAETDDSGRFALAGLARPGCYWTTLSRSGFATSRFRVVAPAQVTLTRPVFPGSSGRVVRVADDCPTLSPKLPD